MPYVPGIAFKCFSYDILLILTEVLIFTVIKP